MITPTISVSSSKSIILFTFGCTLAIVLMTIQYQHKLLLFNSPRLMLTLPSLSLISVCGLGAALVGVVYPMLIKSIQRQDDSTVEKSQICKSLVIFVGINHLCAKIPFPSDLHFSSMIIVLCIAFWWWFDGSMVDFLFSILISLTLTITIEILIRAGALQYTYSDFYLKTCVPCLTFAGAILIIQITKLLSQDHLAITSTLSTEMNHMKTE